MIAISAVAAIKPPFRSLSLRFYDRVRPFFSSRSPLSFHPKSAAFVRDFLNIRLQVFSLSLSLSSSSSCSSREICKRGKFRKAKATKRLMKRRKRRGRGIDQKVDGRKNHADSRAHTRTTGGESISEATTLAYDRIPIFHRPLLIQGNNYQAGGLFYSRLVFRSRVQRARPRRGLISFFFPLFFLLLSLSSFFSERRNARKFVGVSPRGGRFR